MNIDLEVGEVAHVNGRLMRYMGNGRFEPVETLPPSEPDVLVKRFDGGGPLQGGDHAA